MLMVRGIETDAQWRAKQLIAEAVKTADLSALVPDSTIRPSGRALFGITNRVFNRWMLGVAYGELVDVAIDNIIALTQLEPFI